MPFTSSVTALPIVGQSDENPFVLTSELLPVDAGELRAARQQMSALAVEQASKLPALQPVLHSGPWQNWLELRQQMRRTSLLRENGLPAAVTLFLP